MIEKGSVIYWQDWVEPRVEFWLSEKEEGSKFFYLQRNFLGYRSVTQKTEKRNHKSLETFIVQ